MTQKNQDKKIEACEALLKQYETLKGLLPALSKIKDHTFQNTVPLLAKWYQVIFETIFLINKPNEFLLKKIGLNVIASR